MLHIPTVAGLAAGKFLFPTYRKITRGIRLSWGTTLLRLPMGKETVALAVQARSRWWVHCVASTSWRGAAHGLRIDSSYSGHASFAAAPEY